MSSGLSMGIDHPIADKEYAYCALETAPLRRPCWIGQTVEANG